MANLTGGPERLTELEKEAVEVMRENNGSMRRLEIFEELDDVDTASEVSDLMRSLRYKCVATYSIDDGQFHLTDGD